jgi:hypothetical protein
MNAPARHIETDDDVADESGLTPDRREIWRMYYTSISTMTHLAIMDASTPAEAKRRIALLRLDLRISDEAVTASAAEWNDPPDHAPAPTEVSHG